MEQAKYNKGTFISWSALVFSFIAIVPVLKNYFFDKPEPYIVADRNLTVFHDFGNIIFQHVIQVKNSGKKVAKVSGIYYYLKKADDNSFPKLLSAQLWLRSSLENASVYAQYPLLEPYILPDNYFEGTVSVFENFSRAQIDEMQELRKKIKKEILETQIDSSLSGPTITPELKSEVQKIISSNLQGFTKGEYKLLIAVANENKEIINPGLYYTFNVYESDIIQLNNITDEYSKGGNGIAYNSNNPNSFTAILTVKKDKAILNSLLGELSGAVKR